MWKHLRAQAGISHFRRPRTGSTITTLSNSPRHVACSREGSGLRDRRPFAAFSAQTPFSWVSCTLRFSATEGSAKPTAVMISQLATGPCCIDSGFPDQPRPDHRVFPAVMRLHLRRLCHTKSFVSYNEGLSMARPSVALRERKFIYKNSLGDFGRCVTCS